MNHAKNYTLPRKLSLNKVRNCIFVCEIYIKKNLTRPKLICCAKQIFSFLLLWLHCFQQKHFTPGIGREEVVIFQRYEYFRVGQKQLLTRRVK